MERCLRAELPLTQFRGRPLPPARLLHEFRLRRELVRIWGRVSLWLAASETFERASGTADRSCIGKWSIVYAGFNDDPCPRSSPRFQRYDPEAPRLCRIDGLYYGRRVLPQHAPIVRAQHDQGEFPAL